MSGVDLKGDRDESRVAEKAGSSSQEEGTYKEDSTVVDIVSLREPREETSGCGSVKVRKTDTSNICQGQEVTGYTADRTLSTHDLEHMAAAVYMNETQATITNIQAGSLATGTNMSGVDLKGDRDESRVAEKAGSSSQEEGTYKEDSTVVDIVSLREPREETSGCGSVKVRKTDTSNICQGQEVTGYTADRTLSTHDLEHMAAAVYMNETQATITNIQAGSLATETNMSDVDLKGDRDESRVAEKAGSSSQEEGTYKEDSTGVEIVYLREPREETSGCGSVKVRKTDTSNICQGQEATGYTADRTLSTHDLEHMAAAVYMNETRATITNIQAGSLATGTNMSGVDLKGDRDESRVAEKARSSSQEEGIYKEDSTGVEIVSLREPREETLGCGSVKVRKTDTSNICQGQEATGYTADRTLSTHDLEHMAAAVYMNETQATITNIQAELNITDACKITKEGGLTLQVNFQDASTVNVAGYVLGDVGCNKGDVHSKNVYEGVMERGMLEWEIQKTEESFEETAIYNKVKERLERFRHVTITGASGEGKTSMALMLGSEYQKKGYELCFVKNISEFKVSDQSQGKDQCFVFDDIFGTVGMSTDSPHLIRILDYLNSWLEQLAYVNSERFRTHPHCSSPFNHRRRNMGNILIIFTTKLYNLEQGKLHLREHDYGFFKGDSVIDLTKRDCRYTLKEKEQMFLKHKKKKNCNCDFDFDKICHISDQLFGFPLTCKLFFDFSQSHEQYEEFFMAPLAYLRKDLVSLLRQKNNKSAALILMLFCEGNLNLRQVEIESNNQALEDHLLTVSKFVDGFDRSEVVFSARAFAGTFFTRGDSIRFSHPSIYDACAFVLYEINHAFVLQHCSIHFLYERVQPQTVPACETDADMHVIYVSDAYNDIIASRLAGAVRQGNYRMSIMHPILKRKDIVDMVLAELKPFLTDTSVTDEHGIDIFYYASFSGNNYLILKLNDVCSMDRTDAAGFLPRINSALHGSHDFNKSNRDDLKFSDVCTDTMLHSACKGGNMSIVEHQLSTTDIDLKGQGGRTPVMYAALCGKNNVFELLVSKGADLKLTDDNNDSVLHLACQGGHKSIVEYLLPLFDINGRGRNGWTAVWTATVFENNDVVDLLVSKGADLSMKDYYDNTIPQRECEGGIRSLWKFILPLLNIDFLEQHDASEILMNALCERVDMIDHFLPEATYFTQANDYASMIFTMACVGKNGPFEEEFLQAFNFNCRGRSGLTGVMIAAGSRNKYAFEWLVSKGADLTLTDDFNNTALHCASAGGNRSTIEYLLASFDINCRGGHGLTAVMMAAVSAKKDAFDLLVSKGADLTLTDYYNNTVLHLACQGGNISIVEYLLRSFDINSRGEHGWTAVMRAAVYAKKDIFDLLVSKGADLTVTARHSVNLLHMSCLGGNADIVEHALPLFDINCQEDKGWTPVMFGASSGKKDTFDLLLSKGANPSLTGDDNGTLLHAASESGNIDIVRHVIGDFDINTRGENGHTPLMEAVCGGHTDVVDFLVDHGADVNVVNNDGDSLLHLACEKGNLKMVKHVMSYSNIELRNKSGWTPLTEAAVFRNFDVFKYLKREGAHLTLFDKAGDDLATLALQGGCRAIRVELGFDVNLRFTPWNRLMKSLVKSRMYFLKHYDQKSSDLVQTDQYGDSLLHLACRGGNIECVEYLLPSYDVNVRGRYNWTPVMMAAVCGHEDVFQLLVSHKADLTLVSDKGDDILTLAMRGKNDGIVKFLMEES